MSKLNPEPRADRNGKVVTRHVKPAIATTVDRSAGITVKPAIPYIEVKENADEGKIVLSSFDDFVNNPSPKDVLTAKMLTVRSIERMDDDRVWDKVMGDGVSRNSVENVRMFERLQLDYLENTKNQEVIDIYSNILKNESASTAHTRAYLAGVESPFDTLFEQLWEDPGASGIGHVTLPEAQRLLADVIQQKIAFEKGELSATAIAGVARDSNARAVIQIAGQIAALEEAIRVHGRNFAANLDAVEMMAEREGTTAESGS